jgi:hypothetical protein
VDALALQCLQHLLVGSLRAVKVGIVSDRGIVSMYKGTDIPWGMELQHKMLGIYYAQMKESKPDALLISHTYNPYFNDIVDMLRLQDIYTDKLDIAPVITQYLLQRWLRHAMTRNCSVIAG